MEIGQLQYKVVVLVAYGLDWRREMPGPGLMGELQSVEGYGLYNGFDVVEWIYLLVRCSIT